MSKINSKGILSGAIGPVYFRTLNGKPIVQSKPGKGNVKQAAATKANASAFGKISTIAKKLRFSFYPIIRGLNDGQMHSRFTSKIYQATMASHELPKDERMLNKGDLSLLEHFQFNNITPFSKYCTAVPVIVLKPDNRIQIELPEFLTTLAITFPQGATQAEIYFFIKAFDPVSFESNYSEFFSTIVGIEQQVTTASQWITPPIPSGQIAFVVAAVFFGKKDSVAGTISLNSKLLHPCEIASVVLAG